MSTAVAAVVALVGISNGFERSFHDVYEAHGVDLVVSRKGAADRLSSAMPESAAEGIRGLDGIEEAVGLLLETLSLEEKGIYGVPTIGLQPDSRLLRNYRLQQGRNLRTGDQNVVLLGVHLASRLGQAVGEKLVFFADEQFEVVGVVESYSAWENSSMIVPLDQLQRLTGREGQITYVNVMLEGPPSQAKVERAVRQIQAMDGKLSAMPTDDFVKTDTRIRLAGAMAWMTSFIALAIGAIGMLNTMMTNVYERTREIGILRAIGWRQSLVVGMILMEAGLLSVAAALLGGLGGFVMTWWLSRLPTVAGMISPFIGWAVLGQGFVIAVVIGLLGAAYPAYRGARLAPTEALRHE